MLFCLVSVVLIPSKDTESRPRCQHASWYPGHPACRGRVALRTPSSRVPQYCLTSKPTRTRNRCLTSKSTRNRVKLPAHAFPRNDMGLVLFLGEDKVAHVPFICKDRIM